MINNKEKRNAFILGIVVTLLVLTIFIPVTALAESMTKTISITYNNIKIIIDGNSVEPKDANGNKVEPFIYNGTTYLPVRAVGEAIGKEVNWDSITKTVYLGENPQTNKIATYTRNNPAPINTPQTVKIENYFETYKATVSIIEIIDGDTAWKKIEAANIFNSAPSEGNKYILVKIKVAISDVKDDKSINLSSSSFTAFSNDNVEYSDWNIIVEPNPQFSGKVYDGGTLEGYVAFEVKKDDINPKIVFGQNYDGTGGIWFKITE
jgi:hypothetical protein